MTIQRADVYPYGQKIKVYVEVQTIGDIETAQSAVKALWGRLERTFLVSGLFIGVEPQITYAFDFMELGSWPADKNSIYPTIEAIRKDCLYILDQKGAYVELAKKDDGESFKVCLVVDGT